ncbi:MAG: hypothetical protein ACRDAX_02405 [Propionibacteriaceae bacterium]
MISFPSIISGCPVFATDTGIRVGHIIIDQVDPVIAKGLLLLDGNCSSQYAAQQYQIDYTIWQNVLTILSDNKLLKKVTPLTVAVLGTSQIAEAIVSLLKQDNHHVLREISETNNHHLDCILIAPATTALDATTKYLVTNSRVPHLLCLPAPGGASVGPFIFPGITACLGCCDAISQRHDPSWAWQSIELANTKVTTSSAAACWAAGLAISQLAALQQEELPATAQETWQLRNGICYQYLWQPDPDCSCQQEQQVITMLAA